MFPFINRLDLIRYLIVWRVNSPLVWLPICLPLEISQVLGTLIANRLPTREAGPWRKALAPLEEYQGKEGRCPLPETAWPVETVLLVYPGKRTWGQGELIVWELKLLGEGADHGLFLEVILPAMEEAATMTDGRWHRQNSLWGRFDLHTVYAARGNRWEPFVQEGRLNLRYTATPTQWAERPKSARSNRLFDRLTWLTPFDFALTESKKGEILPGEVPTLKTILEHLVQRLALFLPGKHRTAEDVWASLSAEERNLLQVAMEEADRIPVQNHRLRPAPKNWPGRWLGSEHFPFIPPSILPYLELASILHVGRQTHFGCGTFIVT